MNRIRGSVCSLLLLSQHLACPQVLNKCDLVDEKGLQRIEVLLKALNRGATVLRTTHGKIDPARILNTARCAKGQ